MHGGQWASTVPAECTASIRVGFFPGTPISDARAGVEEALKTAAAPKSIKYSVRCVFFCYHDRNRYFGFAAEGFEVDAQTPLLACIGKSYEQVTGKPATYEAVTCTTDARHFQLYYGIPATCYGPEYTRNIHGIDESVGIDAVVTVVAVIARFICDWCGVEPERPQ